MNQYLKETKMLDFSNPSIQKLIETKRWKEQNKFDCLKSIYNFIRDDLTLLWQYWKEKGEIKA